MNILILGATGLVGESLINLLEKSNIIFDNIYFVASNKSLNRAILFKKKKYYINVFEDINLNEIDICCNMTSSNAAKYYIPILQKYNIKIIDNSSAFRDVYGITIPEINYKENDIYINPNCCIIQSIIPLFYINKESIINKIIYNTYQSCSGGGYTLLNELKNNKINNCIPIIGDITPGDSSEETKLINETKKLLNVDSVYANCVRVPTMYGHLVNIIFQVNLSLETIKDILMKNTIYDENCYKINIENDTNIYTCRLKKIDEFTFSFYTYANNILRGASYNTFKILNEIVKTKNNN